MIASEWTARERESVCQFNYPTQAKTRLEWATRLCALDVAIGRKKIARTVTIPTL
jgi:hypothetical protein